MTVGAVILAAGFGTRLAPLTDHTPKPLLVVGEHPVASHLLARLRELPELTDVVVVVNDRHLEQWRTWQRELHEQLRVHILSNGVTDNDERPGAVADLALATSELKKTNPGADWCVVLAGDNLLDEALGPHVAAAVAAERPVVLCRDLGTDVPGGRFGEITVDASHVITRFREKPATPESPLAATCSYVLPASAVVSIDDFLGSGGDPDSPGSFIGWLASRRPVLARTITGQYHDIGNHETLAAARAFYSR